MARFTYLGEPSNPAVTSFGPCIEIKVPKKDGTIESLLPISPATSFEIGQDIGHEITCPRALRSLRANPRFQEI